MYEKRSVETYTGDNRQHKRNVRCYFLALFCVLYVHCYYFLLLLQLYIGNMTQWQVDVAFVCFFLDLNPGVLPVFIRSECFM